MVSESMIATAVRRGAKFAGELLSVELVWQIVVRTIKDRHDSLLGYAFTSGRNAGLDKRRCRMARVNRIARLKAEASRLLAGQRWERVLVQARREFDGAATALPRSRRLMAHRQQMEMVRLRVLESATAAEIADAFPGSTANQRYQWKRRGIMRLLASELPPALREVLQAAIS